MVALLEMPPRGHYYANEAGGLAGVTGYRIGQWARRGYIRASQSPEIPLVYAFQDIAEAMVVHELEDLGVTHKEILATTDYVRAEHGYDWPLLHADLAVTVKKAVIPPRPSGKEPEAWLLVKHGPRYIRPATSRVQGVLNVDVRAVALDLQRGGWVVRDLPDLEHVEVNPDRLSGRPTIRGRRIPAEDVAETALAPGGREELHEGYDLTDAQIDDAVRWWQRVQEYEAA